MVSPAGSAQVLQAQLPQLPAAPSLPVPVPSAPSLPSLPSAPAPSVSPLPLPVAPPPLPAAGAPKLSPLPAEIVQPLVAPASGAAGSAGAAPAANPRSGGRSSSSGAAAARGERLRGKKLRRLRRALLDQWACADALSGKQRRALVLRAGLFGRKPMPRAAIARRLGVSPRRALRLERSGRTFLRRAGECDEAAGTPAHAIAIAIGSVSRAFRDQPQPGEADGGGGRDQDVGAVGGASKSGGSPARPGSVAEADGGLPSATLLMILAFLVILLALLAAAGLAARRAGIPAGLLARRRRRFQKPLLFLDVDGVIALWPPIQSSPPGRTYDFESFRVYINGRCGEYIRALQRRFEIVWATGWEDDANRHLRPVLGLERDLPTLKFGGTAIWGSSEWKIPAIERAAGERPIAWIDDTIGARHRSWARRRDAPTMLVKTTSDGGISVGHVRELLAWADSIERDGEHVERRPREASAA